MADVKERKEAAAAAAKNERESISSDKRACQRSWPRRRRSEGFQREQIIAWGKRVTQSQATLVSKMNCVDIKMSKGLELILDDRVNGLDVQKMVKRDSEIRPGKSAQRNQRAWGMRPLYQKRKTYLGLGRWDGSASGIGLLERLSVFQFARQGNLVFKRCSNGCHGKTVCKRSRLFVTVGI